MTNLQPEIDKFKATCSLQEAMTPPSSWYVMPEFLNLEKETVFKKHWQFVGRVDQVKEPGDYFTGEFLGEPFVVTRNDEGNLKAFYNVCAHHATCVAKETGKTQKLICPYHGWEYNLDGKLIKAPKAGKITGLSKISLKPIQVTAWGPFVALYFGEDKALDLQASYRSLYDELQTLNFHKMTFVKRIVYPINCNWKVFIDNYLDGGYHVPFMHPGLASQLDLANYSSEQCQNYSVQRVAAANKIDSRELEPGDRVGGGAIYAWLHPNFVINRYGNVMDTNWVIPVAPNRCLTIFDYYLESCSASDLAEFEKGLPASDKVQQEDIEICHMVQKGLASSGYNQGPYAAQFEGLMYEFHRLLKNDFIHFE